MSKTKIDGESAPSSATTPEKIDGEDYVRWAYRLLLGREPESLATVQRNPFKNDRPRLVHQVLNSAEFRLSPEIHKYKALSATPTDNPYVSWNEDAIAFIHLPKTGGTTLRTLIKTCFPQNRICPQEYNALHLYSPAELAKYDFFAGHFDYFSLRFIPRERIRCFSIFRDPIERLISFYKFSKSHPPSDEFINSVWTKLANSLDAAEFFEHNCAINSRFINNSYLFFFGSSMDDETTLAALAATTSASPVPNDLETAADTSTPTDTVVAALLARATQRVLDLNAIGITEKFSDSVEIIFLTLGFPVPPSIFPARVTDDLPNSDARFSRVPPVVMTERLSRALQRLTKYDRVIYETARREFERRRSAALLNGTQNSTGVIAPGSP